MLTVHFQVTVRCQHTTGKSLRQPVYKTLKDVWLQPDTIREPESAFTKMPLIKLCEYSATEQCFTLAKLFNCYYFFNTSCKFTVGSIFFSFMTDVAPALLLLALTCDLWQVAQTHPVKSTGQMSDTCVADAQALLKNITDTLLEVGLQNYMSLKSFACRTERCLRVHDLL